MRPTLAFAALFVLLLLTLPIAAQTKKEQEQKLLEEWKTFYTGCEKLGEYSASGPIAGMSFLPGGKQLFIACENGEVSIVEPLTGKQIKKLPGHKESILDASVSKDGKYAATASADDTVKVWDISAGTEWRSLKHPGDVKSVAFSPDGKKCVTGCADGMLRLWVIMDNKEVKALEMPREKGAAKSPIRTVGWAGNGNYVMAGDEAGSYVAYDWKDYYPYVQGGSRKGDYQISRVGFTSDSTHYYYLTSDGVGRVGCIDDKDNGAFITVGDKPTSAATSNNSKFMVIGFENGSTSLLSLEYASGNDRPGPLPEVRTLETHSDALCAVAFSPDGARIATASRDGKVYINGSKNAAPGGAAAGGGNAPPLTKTLPDRGYLTYGVALSADGRLAATGGEDFTARIYDVASGALKVTLGGHTGAIRDLAFSPVEAVIVTASDDKTLRVWNAGTGKEIRLLSGHNDKVMGCAVSKDGKTIISAGADKSVRLWDLQSGKQNKAMVLPSGSDCCCFSADGKNCAASCRDGSVKIWDITGKDLKALALKEDYAQSLAFSPDGKKLVTLSRSGRLVLWDWATATAEKTFEEGVAIEGTGPSTISATSLAFSKDGTKLARGNATDVKVFNVADGSEISAILGLGAGPYPLSIYNNTLATSGGDGKLRVWDLGG